MASSLEHFDHFTDKSILFLILKRLGSVYIASACEGETFQFKIFQNEGIFI